jgi:hypothetical protein
MIALTEKGDARARMEAVEDLASQDELVRVACTDDSPHARLLAVSKVTDDQNLLKVVKEAKDLDVRLVAVERISSQQILSDIVKRRENLELIGMCFTRITDRKIIESIAQDPDCNPVARRMAVEHFADESYLAEASETAMGRKSREAVDAFVEAYGGGLRGVRAIGRFRRSEKALKALGTIAARGGECGGLAIEYLCGGLGSSNQSLKRCAADELANLRSPELVGCLVRSLDNPALREPIREVLQRIDTPEARAALGQRET